MLFDHLMTIQYLMQPYKICVTYWCDNVFSLTVVSPEDYINMTLRVAIICYWIFCLPVNRNLYHYGFWHFRTFSKQHYCSTARINHIHIYVYTF